MKRLSHRQAGICETATGLRCRCRCGGVLHGAVRSPAWTALPTDPHWAVQADGPDPRVQLELPGFVKEGLCLTSLVAP